MFNLVSELVKSWPPIIAHILLTAGITFVGLRWFYHGQLTTSAERIKLKDDQIRSLADRLERKDSNGVEERLSAALESAEERLEKALSDIQALKVEQAAAKSHRLSEDQIQLMSGVLSLADGQTAKIEIEYNISAARAAELANDLVSAFQDADWNVDLAGTLDSDFTGPLRIQLQGAIDRPAETKKVRKALMRVGIQFDETFDQKLRLVVLSTALPKTKDKS